MSLFVTTAAILFTLIFAGGSLVALINYTVNKVKGSREDRIADRHDALIQEKHFKKD